MNNIKIYNIKEINNIITDYKNDLEYQDVFKKCLEEINKITYVIKNNKSTRIMNNYSNTQYYNWNDILKCFNFNHSILTNHELIRYSNGKIDCILFKQLLW